MSNNANILQDPKIGALYRLTAFKPPERDYFVRLMASHNIRPLFYDQSIFIAKSDIDAHSNPDDDGSIDILQSLSEDLLPSCDDAWLYERVYAASNARIATKHKRLTLALSYWPHSAPSGLFNCFGDATKLNAGALWQDIALVACHRTSPQNASLMMEANEAFLRSCAEGNADVVGLPSFFRSLLRAAGFGLDHDSHTFSDLWYCGHGYLMPSNTAQRYLVANCLLQLVRAAQGWRGDPHGAMHPDTLMGQCLQMLRPSGLPTLRA